MNIEEAITYIKEKIKNKLPEYTETVIDGKTYRMNVLQLETKWTKKTAEALEILLTAYEKEKGENVKLRLQDIHLIEGELKAYKDRVNELKIEIEKEKEKNKKAKEFIQENSHEFNCKRDDLMELEFDDNTNASDLIDILDGNW